MPRGCVQAPDGVGGQRHAPAALPPPPVKTCYPLYRWLRGTQGRSGGVRKISPSSGYDPRTIQPIASRYTDYAIPAHNLKLILEEFFHFEIQQNTRHAL
jgi:hypothetical protein